MQRFCRHHRIPFVVSWNVTSSLASKQSDTQDSHTFKKIIFHTFSIPFQYWIKKVQYHYFSSFPEMLNYETHFYTLHNTAKIMKCFAFSKSLSKYFMISFPFRISVLFQYLMHILAKVNTFSRSSKNSFEVQYFFNTAWEPWICDVDQLKTNLCISPKSNAHHCLSQHQQTRPGMRSQTNSDRTWRVSRLGVLKVIEFKNTHDYCLFLHDPKTTSLPVGKYKTLTVNIIFTWSWRTSFNPIFLNFANPCSKCKLQNFAWKLFFSLFKIISFVPAKQLVFGSHAHQRIRAQKAVRRKNAVTGAA